MAEIEKWHERGVVRRWTRAEAVKTGARIFQARWVDDPMKCKSRYVIKEYANQKDLSVFAAASDFATSRLVDYKAVRCSYPTFVFDVTSAYTHADEDEQVFLEPPEEEKAIHGDCLWESVKVIYGRRKGARSWQDHFVSVVQSPEAVEAGFTVKVHEKCPTMFYLVEADGLFELHVDDGHGTGRPDVIRKFLEYISQKIELKWVDGLKEGMSYEYLKTIKYRTNEGIWSIPSEKYIDSALERFGMTGCNPSSSPKVSKAEEPGDQSPVTEETASGFRSSVLTLLYMANERSDIQSTVRFLCTRLKEPVQGDVRRLKKLLRYMQGTRNVGTLFRADTSDEKVLKVFSDADWATDGRSRKSTSGAVIMASGCRLHAHSRGQDVVALSSCEAELYASSEAIKEAVLLKEMLLFCGMGEYSLELALDASSTRQLLYRKGPGRMKHLDVRALWLQDLVAHGGLITKKIDRAVNLADVLTHPPTCKELEVFMEGVGMADMTEEEHKQATSKSSTGFRVAAKLGGLAVAGLAALPLARAEDAQCTAGPGRSATTPETM
jgi:hypothetical protein